MAKEPAHVCFRRDVADDEAVAAAGETSVCDERDILAETAAHDGRGGRKHFAHSGPAFRPFVANDDDVALLDRAVEDRCERRFFALKHQRAAGECQPSLPEIFATAPFGARFPASTTRWLSFLIGLSNERTTSWPSG